MRRMKYIVRRYPYQFFMLVYNGGVFTLLESVGVSIKNTFSNDVWFSMDMLSLSCLSGKSVGAVQNFFATSPYKWLFISMISSFVLSFVDRLVRLVFTVIIIGLGLYLAYVYLSFFRNLI